MSAFQNVPLFLVQSYARTPFPGQTNPALNQLATRPATTKFPNGSALLTTYGTQFARTKVMTNEYNYVKPLLYGLAPTTDGVKWQIIVTDTNGKVVALPQDVLNFSFEDDVNGGSASGSIEVPRRFVDIGWIGVNFRVQFYLDDGIGDPWYDGYVTELDQTVYSGNTDRETVTVITEGWQTALGWTAVFGDINAGVQQNGVDNGIAYCDAVLNNYLIPIYLNTAIFGPSHISSIPIGVDSVSWDGTALNTVIDNLIKNVQSNTGYLYEWWVRGRKKGLPSLVIQPQGNPSQVTASYQSPTQVIPAFYFTEFMNSTMYEYQIQNVYKDIVNMVELYGGTDPTTSVQCTGAFQDSTSISLYGLRQKKETNNALISQTQLSNYATVYLLLNGYPQPQASFKKLRASDWARAGQWFQVFEPGVQPNDTEYFITASNYGVTPYHTQNCKQVRAIKVVCTLQDLDRIEQQVYTTAPRTFIDNNYYGALKAANTQQASNLSSQRASQAKLSNFYIVGGGDWTGNT